MQTLSPFGAAMTSEGKLSQLCRRCGLKQPTYSTERRSGPGPEEGFVCSVAVGSRRFSSRAAGERGGGHTTKRAAEEDAAGVALEEAVRESPSGAHDAEGLLRWLEGAGRLNAWKPFQVSRPICSELELAFSTSCVYACIH